MELYPLKTKQNEQIELLEMRASFGITFRSFSIIVNLRNNFLFISMRSNSLAFLCNGDLLNGENTSAGLDIM